MTTNRLYVANIPFRANEDTLRDVFAEFGTVNEVRLVYGERGHKGFGFIEMGDAEQAKIAINELNGAEMMGRELAVDYAKERPHGNRRESNPRDRTMYDKRPGRY